MILAWNLNQQLNLTRETKNVKKFDDDVISENCDVIVIFQFLTNLEQFGGWISDTVWKSSAFSESNLLPNKNWKQN